MYIEIDQGNTRLKWRFQDTAMCTGGISKLQKQLKKQHLHLVRLVSVCSEHRRQQLINAIILHAPQPLEWRIARSTSECMQIRNAYDRPEQLGADRWSALVAAASEYQNPGQAVAILGCGSAITLDLIDSDKNHLGGFIAPGFTAMQHGLRHTTNLCFDPIDTISTEQPATHTQGSVEWGIHMQINGLVQQIVGYCDDRFDRNWQLIMHGGDTPKLLPSVQAAILEKKIDATFCPELVLNGLKYITESCDKPTTAVG